MYTTNAVSLYNSDRLELLDTSILLLPYLTTEELQEFVNKYSPLHHDNLTPLSKDCKFIILRHLGYFDIIRLLSVNKSFRMLKNETRYKRDWIGVIIERLKLMFKNRRYNFKAQTNFDVKEFLNLYIKYKCVNIKLIDIYLFIVWMDDYGKNLYDFASIRKADYTDLNKLFSLYRIWLNASKIKPRCEEKQWSNYFLHIPSLNTKVYYNGPVEKAQFYNITPTVLQLLDVNENMYISREELANKIEEFIDKNFTLNKNKRGEITSYVPKTKQGEWIVTRQVCEYKECTHKGVTKKVVKWKMFRSKDRLIERIAGKTSSNVKSLFWYHDITKVL